MSGDIKIAGHSAKECRVSGEVADKGDSFAVHLQTPTNWLWMVAQTETSELCTGAVDACRVVSYNR